MPRHEDSEAGRFLTSSEPSVIQLPSQPMPRLFPVCCEFAAGSPPDPSHSTSAASSARWPRGGATTPASFAFSSPVIAHLSARPAFWLLLTRMLSGTSSLSFPASARPASRRVIRTPVVARRASRAVSRTLAQRLRPTGAKPNLALQRTATAVTAAAIHVRCRSVRAGRCFTSVASFFAPPSQPPRQPPRSLSLRSLAVSSAPCSQ